MKPKLLNSIDERVYERLAGSVEARGGLPVTVAAALRLYERRAASTLLDIRALRILCKHVNRLERFSRASRRGAIPTVRRRTDLEILNRNAALLNSEAEDALSYQIEL